MNYGVPEALVGEGGGHSLSVGKIRGVGGGMKASLSPRQRHDSLAASAGARVVFLLPPWRGAKEGGGE